jgi:hypothetical protein
MAQAPGYNRSDLEREQIVRPGDGYTNATTNTGPVVSPVAGSKIDFVRWGPIWAGFFTIITVLLILGSLGLAISAGGYGLGHTPSAFSYGWAIGTGVIAYVLGGWVAARAAGVGGLWNGLLLGSMVWALSFVAFLVVAIAGATNVLGLLSGNLLLITRAGAGAAGSAGTGSWTLFATLIISYLLAAFGGMVGIRGWFIR